MFNSKKIKELEGDIKTLYSYIEHLQRKIDGNEAFESFCTNRRQVESNRLMRSIYNYLPSFEPVWENVSTKAVLALVLKKMGFKISYEPAEFRLVKGND